MRHVGNNKMKNILLTVFIATTVSMYANDGGIAIIGGAFHPVNIANVSMDYERLNITCRKSYFKIEAYIELYNHDGVTRPLLGFEFYEGNLSHWGNYNLHDNVNQFILLVNGRPQRFEYGVQDRADEIRLIHTLVYRPELNPGKNMVYHKLQLPYGFGSMEGVVSYLLETSSRWKDGNIKNLEIFIRTEFSTILLIKEYPGYNTFYISSFDTIGESKLYQKYTHEPGGGHSNVDHEYYSLMPNGYLYKHIENFVPNRNIQFQLLDFLGMEMYIQYDDPPYNWFPCDNPYIMIHDWKRYIENPNFTRYRWGDSWRDDPWRPSENMLEELSTEQLRILRNTLYAIRGYVFNDVFLRDYFNRQYWYFPNPNIALNSIVLSAAEHRILRYILAEENRR